ncbi:hypothetical protein EXIGLDRAFT_233841 [Exidia glandulosa HHB12029]|uniref:Uncharacterized protein n=1 Tax=Exidia glandulosa HHB12029 TaxID=1314781 RepID=A0A165MJB5_EXIGL|nr:hypothetical protein EXIGLDRAFT_233841 [Exidia glandulosa HHB12029]
MSATTADQIQEVQNALLALADAYKDVDDALSEDGYTAPLLHSVQPQSIDASASPTQSDEFDPQLLEDGEIAEDDDVIVGEDGLVEAAGASEECDRRNDNAAAIGDVLPARLASQSLTCFPIPLRQAFNPSEPTCNALQEHDETELSALRQRTQELTEQLTTLVSTKNTQTSELEELKAQFAALTAAHATVISENNSMRQQHFAVVQYKTRAIEALVAAGGKLKLELNTLSGRLQEAETITKSIEGLVSHYGSLDMPVKLALLEKELSEGQIVKAQVQGLHASNQDYSEQIRKLQADMSTMNEEKRRAEEELQRLKGGSQEVPQRPPLGNSNTPIIARSLSQVSSSSRYDLFWGSDSCRVLVERRMISRCKRRLPLTA